MLGKIRLLIAIVIAGLLVSGLTAFRLERDIGYLQGWVQHLPVPAFVAAWIDRVAAGMHETYRAYPFIAYGTDWLAFGHIVIAIFLFGAWIDPVRNIWLLRAGQIACLLVIPTALLCGAARGIPLWWRATDSSFGIAGFIPLWFAERLTRRLEAGV